MMFLSSNIKHLRLSKQLKQLEVCALLDFKTSTWNNYERGLSSPNYHDLLKISHFFEVNAGDLLELDLSKPYLNESSETKKEGHNPHLNPSANPYLNTKKAPIGACKECEVKDIIIGAKEQLLQSNTKLIHSQEAQIQLLQNQLDQMKYDTQERDRNRQPQQKERKTA